MGVLLEVGRALWQAVAGTSEDRKEAALAIAEVALKAGLEEAKRRAEQLGLVIATMQLDLAMQRMLAAIRAAAEQPSISIPSLLDMEQMPADWKPEPDTLVVEVGDAMGDGSGHTITDASKR
jgi:hypothetical protein